MAANGTGTMPGTGVARGVVIRTLAAWVLLPLFFVATGGSLRWWEAWIYCALLLIPMTVFLLAVARRDPEFLARRFQMKEKERQQRRVLAWGYPVLLAAFIIPGLDRRFGWSDPPPWVIVAALAASLAGYLGVLRVFWENRWAGRTVETWAGQQLVATGPYRVVRHPMYASSTILYLATHVALGSRWALLPALAVVPVLVFRIRNEEDVLVRDLAGYREYREQVRYRLVPFVW
jgi:protein-S-isoprenylcysteine O-methyltransferase Ste14